MNETHEASDEQTDERLLHEISRYAESHGLDPAIVRDAVADQLPSSEDDGAPAADLRFLSDLQKGGPGADAWYQEFRGRHRDATLITSALLRMGEAEARLLAIAIERVLSATRHRYATYGTWFVDQLRRVRDALGGLEDDQRSDDHSVPGASDSGSEDASWADDLPTAGIDAPAQLFSREPSAGDPQEETCYAAQRFSDSELDVQVHKYSSRHGVDPAVVRDTVIAHVGWDIDYMCHVHPLGCALMRMANEQPEAAASLHREVRRRSRLVAQIRTALQRIKVEMAHDLAVVLVRMFARAEWLARERREYDFIELVNPVGRLVGGPLHSLPHV